LLAAHST